MELLVKAADDRADYLLELLEKLDFVEVEKRQRVSEQFSEFSALKPKTKGWKFYREEANER